MIIPLNLKGTIDGSISKNITHHNLNTLTSHVQNIAQQIQDKISSHVPSKLPYVEVAKLPRGCTPIIAKVMWYSRLQSLL